MMDAVDEYQVLYPTLPRRLSGLNKVGFRESGGMVVCMFTYNGVRSLLRILSTWLFGTGPRQGERGPSPGGQRMIESVRIPDCGSARRGS